MFREKTDLYLVTDEESEVIKCKIPSKGKLGHLVAQVYNPTQDLVALGYENGTILVKRFGWKTCWKKELATEVGNPIDGFNEHEDLEPVSLVSLCWSPDGEMLLANMFDGKMHMMWAECGKIAYSYQGKGTYRRMKWLKFGTDAEVEELRDVDTSCYDFATAEKFNFNEEATKQASAVIVNFHNFLMKKVPLDYADTLVVGMPDDGVKVDLYAAGILYFKTVDAVAGFEFGPNTDTMSLELLDCDISFLVSPRFNIGFKVMEYGKEVIAGVEVVEEEEDTTGYSTYVSCVDIGLATGDIWAIVRVTLFYSRMLYFSVFIRELCQYTFNRIDEKTGIFYEQSLNELVRNYKVQNDSPNVTLFHEVVNHLCGKKVSKPFTEVFKKGKGAPQCIKALEDFCHTKMKNFGVGLQLTSMTVDIMKKISLDFLDIFHSRFLPEEFGVLSDSIPNSLKGMFNFYADVAVLQYKIEQVADVLNEKKDRLTMLHSYLSETMSAVGDDQHPSTPINLEDVDPMKLVEFLGEALELDDVRIPKAEMPSIDGAPYRHVGDKIQCLHELIDFMRPLGFYHIPPFVPECAFNCPHQRAPKNADKSNRFDDRSQTWKDEVSADFDPMVSVYTWHNEKCFDFLCKYFAEYTSSGFPPECITQIEKNKLADVKTWETLLPKIRKLLPRRLPRHSYLKDEDVVKKMFLRPTVFMSMLPMFEFQPVVCEFLEKHYPVTITTTVHKIEQCNTRGAPVIFQFLKNEQEIEKRFGKEIRKVADATLFQKPEDPSTSSFQDDPLSFLSSESLTCQSVPLSMAAVFMIHPNCVGRSVLVFQDFEFEAAHIPSTKLTLSTLSPTNVLWKDAIRYMDVKAAAVRKCDQTVLVVGDTLGRGVELIYYNLVTNKTETSDVKIDDSVSVIHFRENSMSILLADENKEYVYWLQKRPDTEEIKQERYQSQINWKYERGALDPPTLQFIADLHYCTYDAK